MGQRFIACDREPSFLMPPDVREWLPEDHLAWFVLDAVDDMDPEAFTAPIERHQDALAGVFGAVLGLRAKAGVDRLNVVAIEGSKIAVNA